MFPGTGCLQSLRAAQAVACRYSVVTRSSKVMLYEVWSVFPPCW